jgi:hypothetical protein
MGTSGEGICGATEAATPDDWHRAGIIVCTECEMPIRRLTLPQSAWQLGKTVNDVWAVVHRPDDTRGDAYHLWCAEKVARRRNHPFPGVDTTTVVTIVPVHLAVKARELFNVMLEEMVATSYDGSNLP